MARSGADIPVGSRSQEGGTRIPAWFFGLLLGQEICFFAHTLQQHGLGKDSGTVSRQGSRRPSDTGMCLKRVPEALPNP